MEAQRRNGVDVKLTKPKAATAAATLPEFNAQAFLDSAGVAKTVVKYGRGEAIFTQGETCDHVMYIQSGGVKLSVLSKTGKEAVVAMWVRGTSSGRGAWRVSRFAWEAPRPSLRAPSCASANDRWQNCCTSRTRCPIDSSRTC